ncbi:PD-(D/E)XK nuclease family protein [Myxococcus sp. MISCRS1]|uniref:PD-(D/E)XK nuclease family protein n=1 Tax=Myxococcus TaxID=32 RepID=UPI001CC0EF3D|nr:MULTISPECIES: PD-(D/E)XK nuclease family protein [Myxococcus]BDT32716.1 PD-(D/E)XK nuclease family protein [Myxococcus sp. MH1]MBZ4400524.1 PD-(D/E)XK nuclease family protein [Myxococcus sp. AS-1-15]MBZ4412902.1 PD-(D/E)XK nuclease family protein [Myxococcus sp. XM-1-1-1]MCK8501266.1 PD-(D/E)XK nuclease family protein [Myxococcus fulvus]MCY0997268.1 PD-(D/E)XK nuclease family protein [Myxococcus sp. MISCRS1]
MRRPPLHNDFSWSKSRHEKFSECLRSYYFYYYRSWGGWEPDAPKDVRELYVLKKLANRFSWAGSVVHESIKDVLLDWRAGRVVDPAVVEARARKLMQDDYRHSRGKAYWTQKYRKQFTGLVEHEYAEALPDEAWKQNWETVRVALAWFFNSRWPLLAKSLKPEQWLEVDAGFDFAHFTLGGLKVFAIPDFAFVDQDGAPVVVDWKTGKSRDGYDEQVLGYALYVSQRYRFPVEKVRASLVYLNEGKEQDVQVDLGAMESFHRHFETSVAKMRALLKDPVTNTPLDADAFPRSETLTPCTRCVFRRPCGREAEALAEQQARASQPQQVA